MKKVSIPEIVSILLLLFLLLCQNNMFMMVMQVQENALPLMHAGVTWFFGGILAGAFTVPAMLRILGRAEIEQGGGRKRTVVLGLSLLAAVALALTAAYFNKSILTAPRLTSVGWTPLAGGVLLSLALQLFFERIPSQWQGRCLGMVFAAVELFWLTLLPVLNPAQFSNGPPSVPESVEWTPFLQTGREALFICIGVAACFALIQRHRGLQTQGMEIETVDREAGLPEYRFAFPLYVVLAIAVFCSVMYGLLGNLFLSTLRFRAEPAGLHAALCLVSVLSGMCIDYYGHRGVRALVVFCSTIFLLIPTLVIAPHGGAVHAFLHYAAYIAYHIFFIAILLLLGRSTREGRFSGLMCVSVYLARGLAFFSFALADEAGRQHADILLLSALILTTGIIIATLRVPALVSTPAAVHAPEAGEELAGTPAEAIPSLMSMEAFAGRYALSRREREVLNLLLEGADSRAIATQLGVTSYTARLHVHHILQKSKLRSRKNILALIARTKEA